MTDHCTQTLSVTEPGPHQYTAWAFDHRDTIPGVLREAGASEHFIRVIDTVIPDLRHSVLMTLYRHHASAETAPEDANAPNVDDAQESSILGGGFYKKLWSGDLAEAFLHADGNNTRIMLEAFEPDEIVTHGVEHGDWSGDREYLQRLVDERVEHYR